jgi:uncharacterized protein YeaO (DUF488 family)
MGVRVERVYDAVKRAKPAGEYRVLVDRLWPRGLRKERVDLDDWAKDIAPSNALRKSFGHDRERWEAFRRGYRAELEPHGGRLEDLRAIARERDLVLLFAAREERCNHARVLEEMVAGGAD